MFSLITIVVSFVLVFTAVHYAIQLIDLSHNKNSKSLQIFQNVENLALDVINSKQAVLVILDIKTTGYSDRKFCEVEQAVRIEGLKIYTDGTIDEMVTLVNPQRPISIYETRRHGLQQRHIRHAPTIENLSKDLDHFVGDTPIASTRSGINVINNNNIFSDNRKVSIEIQNMNSNLQTRHNSISVQYLAKCTFDEVNNNQKVRKALFDEKEVRFNVTFVI
jgi:hypothetical protein